MIIKNIIWSFAGGLLPLIIGVIIFPLVISKYGADRFGILAIAWSLVGYFSFFDMGFSRALTQIVSSKLSKNDSYNEIAEVVRTTFRMMWILGAVGGLVLWAFTPYLVRNILSISSYLQIETIRTFSILSLAIPFVVHTSALRGLL